MDIYRNRQDLCNIDVNPDSHMNKCPVLDPESLGKYLYSKLGRYHKTCRLRYSNSRVKQLKGKLSEAVSLKPVSKAGFKMERHVSTHDNTNAALMSAGIDAVRTF